MINETNYHLFLDDFVNGLLDEEMELDFVAFLDKHPNILEGESLESYDAGLTPEFKRSLKKEIPVAERNIDELLIAAMEGDLSEQEANELAKHIRKTPALQHEKSLFALTRLEPDLSIRFPHKSSLRKRPVIIMYSRWVAGVAAVFVLGMMISRFAVTPDPGTGISGISDPVTRVVPSFEVPVIGEEETASPAMSSFEEMAPLFTNSQTGEKKFSEGIAMLPVKQEIRVMKNKPHHVPVPELRTMAVMAFQEEQIETGNHKDVLASNEQTVWQWAYKKLRAKAGEPEMIIPEKEIPRDAANLVLAKVAPVFEYNQNNTGSLIRIGGVEINRRSTR